MSDTVGNTLATATRITLSSSPLRLSESVSNADLADYYRFSLSRRSSFVAKLTDLSANAELILRNSAGGIVNVGGVAQISNNGGSLTELLTTTLDAGTYYIQVSPGPVGSPPREDLFRPATNYTLAVLANQSIGLPDRIDLVGNVISAPLFIGSLNGNAVYRERIDSRTTNAAVRDLNDYYLFSLGTRTRFALGLTGPGGNSLTGNLNVQLLNASAAPIFQSTNLGTAAESIATTLDPGSYYVRVYSATANADASDYDLRLNINSLPILATNRPLVAQEGAATALTSNNLNVRDDNNIPPQITYRLLASTGGVATSVGSLSLSGALLTPGSAFTQADINNSRLTYRHNGSETSQDSFAFSVTDGTAEGVINNQTFTISVTPTNDAPTVSLNVPLTAAEGADTAFTAANLLGTDVEQPSDRLFYTISTRPTNGTLLLAGSPLTIGRSFTQADINSGTNLVYRHNGSETPLTDSFTFSILDGAGGITGGNTFSFRITPTNDPPVLVTNRGLTVLEGSTTSITAGILNATDAELQTAAQRDQIIYTIVEQPQNGFLSRGTLTGITTFTQADIESANNRISYTSNETDNNSDRFTFSLSDTVDSNNELYTFSIAVLNSNFVPVLTTNVPATVTEGSLVTLASSLLQVTDADNPATQLTYTVSTLPIVGTLNRNGTPLSLNQTFTQADIDSNQRITYVHNGNETPAQDTFVFSASDPSGSGVTGRTFTIAVAPSDDPPSVVTNTVLTVTEGAAQVISTAFLSATDPDSLQSSLIYTLAALPTNGSIVRDGQTLSELGATFSQAVLGANLLQYRQNGNESTSDSFVFRVGSGEATTADQTFNIEVIPVNDPPVLLSNTGITLAEGARETIGDNELLVTDNDGPGLIAYTLASTPTLGQLVLSGQTLSANATFTPADITNNRLEYVHGGSETPLRDSFTFTASDGGGGNSPVNSFSITITPVNDPPVLTLPTAGLTLTEDTTRSFSGPDRISVTDAENDTVTLTLSVNSGVVILGGNTSATVERTGTASAINSALSSLSYRPNRDFNGTDRLNIRLSDGAGNVIERTLDLVVTPVNDSPTLTITPATVRSATEDTPLPITGILAADVDSGELPVRLTLSTTSGGLLTLGAADTVEFITGTNGSSSLEVAGRIADIATALAGLTYQGARDYNGSDSIVILLDDQGNSGGTSTPASGTISVNVAAVNDLPSFTIGSDVTVLEDAPRQTVANQAIGISAGAPNESNQQLTFISTVDNAALFTNNGRPQISPTGELSFTLAPNAFGSAVVTVTLRDSGAAPNTSAPQSFTINALPVNDAPSFTRTNGTITVLEDAPAQSVTIAAGITAGPGEVGQDLRFNILSNSNEALFTTESLTLSPAGLLSFTPAPNAFGTAVLAVQLQDEGSLENGGVNVSPIQSYTINVTAVNDAPVLSLPTNVAGVENEPIAVTGTTITDIDATGALVVTLSALGTGAPGTAGTITVNPTPNVTVATTNNGSTVTLRGLLADLNAVLSSFTYRGRGETGGQDRVVVTVNDQGSFGSGGQLTDTETLTIDVSGVNDPPVLTISGNTSRTATEDLPLTLGGLSVSDVDAGAEPLQVVLSAQNGFFNANPTTNVNFTGQGTSTLTISGPVGSINTALTSLRYQGNADFFSSSPETRDLVSITVSDQGTQPATGTLTIDVRPVNDLPRLTLPTGPLTVVEDGEFAFTEANSAAIAFTDVDSGSNLIQATLAVTNGRLNVTQGSLRLISGANDTNTATYEGTQADIQAALNTLIFRPNENYNGGAVLTVRVNDRGATGSTNAPDVLRTVSFTVTSVNDLPGISLNNPLIVNEGGNQVITNGVLRVTDADTPDAQLVYTVVTPPSSTIGSLRLNTSTVLAAGATFTQADINANRISYVQNGSEATGDSFVFRVTDGGTPIEDTTFTVQINPISDPPVLTANQVLNVSEGQAGTITSTLLQATDPDTAANLLVYTLSSTPRSGSLQLNGTNLSIGQTFTQSDIDNGGVSYSHNGSETTGDSFTFTIGDDDGGSTGTQLFTINVSPVDDPSVVVSRGPLTLSEGTLSSLAGALVVTDADTPSSNIRYTLSAVPVYGALQRSFSGSPLSVGDVFTQDDVNSGRIIYANNGSERPTDNFQFRINGSQPEIFDIVITPVNDTPVLQANTGLSVSSTRPSTTVLTPTQLRVTDADTPDSQITFTLQAVPIVGRITLRGAALSSGGTFTQQDVRDGAVRYEYAGTGGSNATFSFRVNDGAGGSIGTQFFNISFTNP
jgi:hypothetical protein